MIFATMYYEYLPDIDKTAGRYNVVNIRQRDARLVVTISGNRLSE